MRLFAFSLMGLAAFMIGCNEPVETIPTVAPTSATTDAEDAHGDHDHVHGDHDHAEGEHEAADLEEGEAADVDSDTAPEPVEGTEDVTEEGEPSASKAGAEAIRFVADKKINVPGMMCPYSCWPKVKETLAAQPGVEDVQLAEQPQDAEEGEIVERVVELKLNGDFNEDAAVAALANANFEAEFVSK